MDALALRPEQGPGAPPITLIPKSNARRLATTVTISPREATRASEVSSASSPPAQSTAASTPPGASALTRSSSPAPYETGSAPNSRSSSCPLWLAVPITRAPAAIASCTAIRPTPPAAPWIRTVSPAPTPTTVSACAAVTPVSIIPLASSNDSGDGLGITLDGARQSGRTRR